MNQPRKEEEAKVPPPTPAVDASAAHHPDEPKKPGLNYVFKIAPADPKNSFDFEDVADK